MRFYSLTGLGRRVLKESSGDKDINRVLDYMVGRKVVSESDLKMVCDGRRLIRKLESSGLIEELSRKGY